MKENGMYGNLIMFQAAIDIKRGTKVGIHKLVIIKRSHITQPSMGKSSN